MSYPDLLVAVDRERAAEVGIDQKRGREQSAESLSSSVGIAPNYFLSPVNGVNYFVGVQMPLAKVTTVSELMNMPINTPAPSTGPGTPLTAPVTPAFRRRLGHAHQM